MFEDGDGSEITDGKLRESRLLLLGTSALDQHKMDYLGPNQYKKKQKKKTLDEYLWYHLLISADQAQIAYKHRNLTCLIAQWLNMKNCGRIVVGLCSFLVSEDCKKEITSLVASLFYYFWAISSQQKT